MEHKDIWLVLGLTVVLAVAVSLSTVTITGNAPKISSITKITPSCELITKVAYQEKFGWGVGVDTKTPRQICAEVKGKGYTCGGAIYRIENYEYSDAGCNNLKYKDSSTIVFDANIGCNRTPDNGPSRGFTNYEDCTEQTETADIPFISSSWQRHGEHFEGVLCCK